MLNLQLVRSGSVNFHLSCNTVLGGGPCVFFFIKNEKEKKSTILLEQNGINSQFMPGAYLLDTVNLLFKGYQLFLSHLFFKTKYPFVLCKKCGPCSDAACCGV